MKVIAWVVRFVLVVLSPIYFFCELLVEAFELIDNWGATEWQHQTSENLN